MDLRLKKKRKNSERNMTKLLRKYFVFLIDKKKLENFYDYKSNYFLKCM